MPHGSVLLLLEDRLTVFLQPLLQGLTTQPDPGSSEGPREAFIRCSKVHA